MSRGKRARRTPEGDVGLEPTHIKSDVSKVANHLAGDELGDPATTRREDLVKEADALRVRILEGMPTRDEMDHPARHPGAIQKHLIWDKRTEKDKVRYREIMRILEPGDPTAIDLEKFRKDDKKEDYR